MMPSSEELTLLRSDMESHMMPDECNILEITQTSDGQGGFTDAWGTASSGTAVACRVDSINARESISGESLQPYHSFVLTLPHGTTITESNRVEVNSETFTVTSVDSSKSWSGCVRAWLEIV